MHLSSYGERAQSPFRSTTSIHSRSRNVSPVREYDSMSAGWRPEDSLLSTSTYGDEYYNPNAYDYERYSPYYGVEDDYYGAYGDLLEYEERLRLAADLSEVERLRRWQDRLAFEELAEAERARRYELMAEEERLRLGLIESSWWARRYGSRHGHSHRQTNSVPIGGWKNYYGNRLRSWNSNRLPLSSSLASRFEGICLRPGHHHSHRRLSNIASLGTAHLDQLNREQIRLTEELRVIREQARLRELEIEQKQRRIEAEIMIERNRVRETAQIMELNRREQERYEEDMRAYEAEKNRAEIERARIQNAQLRQEVVSNLQAQEQELRLRRELDRAGNGLYNY